ncbi:MAG: ArsR family transcriptional regulator [Candidatus Nitrosocosmicus sp.]|nr:ArsR family transcriptional regulator [Candidatus Nitrosocosmicus sp.]MDN5866080.1 ArsR family transcriptional regulator [Candidatus Nitrosocosmicus sp.]
MSLENRTNNKNNNFKYVILTLIIQIPGIRYNDLARITKFNNGVISHSLRVLEKNNLVKVVRCSNGKITRYFTSSIPDENCPIIAFLKNETTRKIILFLHYNRESNFEKIRHHINETGS